MPALARLEDEAAIDLADALVIDRADVARRATSDVVLAAAGLIVSLAETHVYPSLPDHNQRLVAERDAGDVATVGRDVERERAVERRDVAVAPGLRVPNPIRIAGNAREKDPRVRGEDDCCRWRRKARQRDVLWGCAKVVRFGVHALVVERRERVDRRVVR